MARPRTPIDTFGKIFREDSRRTSARLTWFQDYDGQLRRVQATADTPKAAERRLKGVLAERNEQNVGQRELTAASSFRQRVDVWLADLDMEDALAPSTRTLYERSMRQLVLPAPEHYPLGEISVARLTSSSRCSRRPRATAWRSRPAPS